MFQSFLDVPSGYRSAEAMRTKKRQRMYIVALLLTMLIWAGSFIFIKISLQEIKPYNLAFYRFILASPVLLLAVYLKKKLQSVKIKDVLRIVILAITGVTLLYAVQFVALMYTTATNSSILMNTSVIFIAVMSFLLGERFTKLKTLGLCLSGMVLCFDCNGGNESSCFRLHCSFFHGNNGFFSFRWDFDDDWSLFG